MVSKAKLIAMLLLCSSSVPAAAIIYNVNQTIGLGSVVGTIQTNGALGALTQFDITAFNLTVSGVGASVQLSQVDSIVAIQGNSFTATASNLFFDYSGPSSFVVFQRSPFGTGMEYYCNASAFNACFQGASAVPESFNSASAQIEARIGTQVLATAAVPEPESWALMIAGFGLVGATMRRRAANARTHVVA